LTGVTTLQSHANLYGPIGVLAGETQHDAKETQLDPVPVRTPEKAQVDPYAVEEGGSPRTTGVTPGSPEDCELQAWFELAQNMAGSEGFFCIQLF